MSSLNSIREKQILAVNKGSPYSSLTKVAALCRLAMMTQRKEHVCSRVIGSFLETFRK